MVDTSETSIRLLAPDPADARAVRVLAAGAFDRDSCDQFTTAVGDALAADSHHVVIDVQQVTSIDAATIRALLICRDLARAAGGSLRVVNDSGLVARILQVTDVRRLLCPPGPPGPVPDVRPARKPRPSPPDPAGPAMSEVLRTAASLRGRAREIMACSRELIDRITADRDARSARRTRPDGDS